MSFNRALKNIKVCLLTIVLIFLWVSIYTIHSSDYGTSYYNYRKRLKELMVVNPNTNTSGDASKIDWIDYNYRAKELTQRGPGEDGQPVFLYTQWQQALAQKTIEEYSYNGAASDVVSLDRSLPDTRHELCKGQRYMKDLPSVSVIIVFHNEYLSFLLRTVHSVINRSPQEILKEIILVDDCSSKEFLGKKLDEEIASYRPDVVKVIRLRERSGLMRARMAGIRAATADIVVVMDAHIEVNTNWLPPLIEPIAENKKTATEPMVNTIHWNTLAYDRHINIGGLGAFDWTLDYDGYPRNFEKYQSIVENYQNPVFLGAIMAINREFFWELNGYDDQLKIWGGEQYDISFKIWMCGGQILRIPCSQIGHNYKEGGYHPYFNFKKGYIYHNYNRIAEVWMDEYKEKYYNLTQRQNISYGNIDKQLEFRKKCKPFKWYVENVLPIVEMDFPVDNLIKNLIFVIGIVSFLASLVLIYMIIVDLKFIVRPSYHALKLNKEIL